MAQGEAAPQAAAEGPQKSVLEGLVPTSGLSPELGARIAAKQSVAALTTDAATRQLEREGWAVRDPRVEEVAVYAAAPLDPSFKSTWSERGVAWVGDLWVPPLAGDDEGLGLHPAGYHLARVPLERAAELAATPEVLAMDTTERAAEVASDLGRVLIGSDALQSGSCVYPRFGAGVSIAILDSGYDLNLEDLPVPVEALDVTEGDTLAEWSGDVTDSGTGHGAHVSSVCFGNGASSSGNYRGIATAADVYIYKVADDATQLIFETDLVKGLDRCATVGVDLANLSIAMYSTFLDGSGPACQAVDAATAAGVMVLAAAGNEAELKRHAKFTLSPGETSPVFELSLFNPIPVLYDIPDVLRVLWRDGQPLDANIELVPVDPEGDLLELWVGASVRGTEGRSYRTMLNVPGGATVSHAYQLVNHATEGDPVDVHVYRIGGFASFEPADPSSTMTVPAIADTAVSIAAWCHRDHWVDSSGTEQAPSYLTEGGAAGFTSRGPRIDGLSMPHLAAPGAAVVGLIDGQHQPPTWLTIDDDGDLSAGPVTHMVRFGTSYATPMVVACLAVLKEGRPDLSFPELLEALRSTASQATAPDEILGSGLIDVLAAALSLQPVDCNELTASSFSLDLEHGGAIDFQVDFGPEQAERLFWILGTLSGTDPGLTLGLSTLLPLNLDTYTLELIKAAGGPPFQGGLGWLDDQGRGSATLQLPSGLGEELSGLTAHHLVLALEIIPDTEWVKDLSQPVPLYLEWQAPL